VIPRNILWVEDDEDIVLSVTPLLEKEGWNVHAFLSAQEAKAAVGDLRPDLIIMDIILESEHGYDVIKDLLSNPQLAAVPVIVFSSVRRKWAQTTATREDALLSEAAEFVDKSAGPKVLINTIHKYLDS